MNTNNENQPVKETILYKFYIHAHGANPNGDFNQENRPRTLENGKGFITGECIRHKIVRQMFIDGHPICKIGEEDDPSNDSMRGRIDALCAGLEDLKKKKDQVKLICSNLLDVRCFGTVLVGKKATNSNKADKAASAASINAEEIPQVGDPEENNDEAETSGKGKKPKGRVITSLGIRGAISLSDAESTEPVEILEMTITKGFCSNQDEVKDMEKNGKDKPSSSVGKRWRVNDATYVGVAAIHSHMRQLNGLTDEDIENFELAFVRAFENDVSNQRPAGSMSIQVVKMVYPERIKLDGRAVLSTTALGWINGVSDGVIQHSIPESLSGQVKISLL